MLFIFSIRFFLCLNHYPGRQPESAVNHLNRPVIKSTQYVPMHKFKYKYFFFNYEAMLALWVMLSRQSLSFFRSGVLKKRPKKVSRIHLALTIDRPSLACMLALGWLRSGSWIVQRPGYGEIVFIVIKR